MAAHLAYEQVLRLRSNRAIRGVMQESIGEVKNNFRAPIGENALRALWRSGAAFQRPYALDERSKRF
jgi:hypothetical protein